jgi:hypothetical protein
MDRGNKPDNTLSRVLTGLFLSLCMIPAVAQDGGLFGTHYRSVIVNTKASGAGVAADVAHFPLLVRLDSTNAEGMFTQVTTGGGDLRVTNATGTDPVAFEVESWDAAGKRAAIWVLAGNVKGNDSAVAFRLYWGRPGAVSNSNPSGVFDTANGFQAVFHFSEGNNDTAYDATANRHSAAPYNAPPDTVGAMGRARKFDGTSQRFQVPNSASGRLNFELTDSYTLSAWVRPSAISTTANSGSKILDKGDNQYSLGVYDNTNPKYWDITTKMFSGAQAWLQCRSNGTPLITAESAVGAWHLVTGTFHGGALNQAVAESLYYDGVPINAVWSSYTSATQSRTTTYNLNIGAQSAGTAPLGTQLTRFWIGALDEIRLENRARSAAWIKLSHATQKPGATAVRLGPTVSTTSLAGSHSVFLSPFLSVLFSGDGVLFRMSETGAAREARMTLTDARGRTVWKSRVDLNDAREAFWKDARAASGIYALRVRLTDADGRIIRTLDRKVPFTR